MPKDMANHIIENTLKRLKPKDIKEQILDFNPVPSNIPEPPKLDNTIKNCLTTRHKQIALTRDDNLKNVQKMVRDSLGPLSRVWALVESKKDDKQLKKIIDIEQVGMSLVQTNLLLGQTQQTLSYNRRRNVLSELSSNTKATALLEQNKELLEEEDSDNELLGK